MHTKPRKQNPSTAHTAPSPDKLAQDSSIMSDKSHAVEVMKARLAAAQQEAESNTQPHEPAARSANGTKASSGHDTLAGPGPSHGNLPAAAHPAASGTTGPPGHATPSIEAEQLTQLSKRATDMYEVIDDRDLKRMRRRLKNREAAQRSRQRKAEETEALAMTVQEHASELADWRCVALHLANNAAALADEVRRLKGVVDPALLEVPLPTTCQASSPVPALALTESYNTTSADPAQQRSWPSEAAAVPVHEQASAPDLWQVVRDALAAIVVQHPVAPGPAAPPSLPPQHQLQPQYTAMDIQPARAAQAMSSADMVQLLRMLTPGGGAELGVAAAGSSNPPMSMYPPLPTASHPSTLGRNNAAAVAEAMRTLRSPFAAMDVAGTRRGLRPAHEQAGVDRPTSPPGELGVPLGRVHTGGAPPVRAASGTESSMASRCKVASKKGGASRSLGPREGANRGPS